MNFAAGARNLDVLPVGERKDSIARAAVVRALCRLAEQRGVAVRVAVGKDNGEAVCGQGGGAQRVEVAGDEDEGRVIRHGGFGLIREQRQHLLCEVVDVGGAGAQVGVRQGGQRDGGLRGFFLPDGRVIGGVVREGGFCQLSEQLCVGGEDVACVRAEAGADGVLQGCQAGGDGGHCLIEGGAVGVQAVAMVLRRVAAPDGGADGRGGRRGGAGEQLTVAAVCRVAEVGGGKVAEGLQGSGSVVAVGVQGKAVAVARL